MFSFHVQVPCFLNARKFDYLIKSDYIKSTNAKNDSTPTTLKMCIISPQIYVASF